MGLFKCVKGAVKSVVHNAEKLLPVVAAVANPAATAAYGVYLLGDSSRRVANSVEDVQPLIAQFLGLAIHEVASVGEDIKKAALAVIVASEKMSATAVQLERTLTGVNEAIRSLQELIADLPANIAEELTNLEVRKINAQIKTTRQQCLPFLINKAILDKRGKEFYDLTNSLQSNLNLIIELSSNRTVQLFAIDFAPHIVSYKQNLVVQSTIPEYSEFPSPGKSPFITDYAKEVLDVAIDEWKEVADIIAEAYPKIVGVPDLTRIIQKVKLEDFVKGVDDFQTAGIMNSILALESVDGNWEPPLTPFPRDPRVFPQVDPRIRDPYTEWLNLESKDRKACDAYKLAMQSVRALQDSKKYLLS